MFRNNFCTEDEINFIKAPSDLYYQYPHPHKLRGLLKKKCNKFCFNSSVDFNEMVHTAHGSRFQ